MSQDGFISYEQIGVAMTCRSFEEYVDMFQLDSESLIGPVLDVAAGASSFTADANQRGIKTVAADPLYSLDSNSLYQRGKAEIKSATEKLTRVMEAYDWEYYHSLEQHERIRLQSLENFHADYGASFSRDHYISARLPNLPFEDNLFSLVLCSHFLFLYEEQFDFQFHLEAIQELFRVCKPGGRILVYPLSTFKRQTYFGLKKLQSTLSAQGIEIRRIPTTFRFLKGATDVLQIRK